MLPSTRTRILPGARGRAECAQVGASEEGAADAFGASSSRLVCWPCRNFRASIPRWIRAERISSCKKYFNIGFAADTPNGLVVPVIANADRLSLYDIARVLSAMSEKARTGNRKEHRDARWNVHGVEPGRHPRGTAFTPIINAPEVAILGVSKSSQKPGVRQGRRSCAAPDAPAVVGPMTIGSSTAPRQHASSCSSPRCWATLGAPM